MTDFLPPLLPRRYRLAWLLLWFALLGALLHFGRHPAAAAPAPPSSLTRWHQALRTGSDDAPVMHRRAVDRPIGATAFR